MKLVPCTYEQHADAILDIFNEAIRYTTALYDCTPRPPERMVEWFNAKVTGSFPVIGAVGADGRLRGFASYGTFRAWRGVQVYCRARGVRP